MKKTLLLTSTLLTAAAFTAQAQISWDGDTDSLLNTATNWVGDVAPSATGDFILDSNTNLAFSGNWAAALEGTTSFGSIEFDTVGTGANAGRFGIRAGASFGRFLMSGDMTFTNTGATQTIDVMDSNNGTLNWAAFGSNATRSINNNSGQTVQFGNGTLGFEFSGWNATNQTLQFGGNSDFDLTSSVTFNDTTTGSPRILQRVYTDTAFGGALTIRDGVTVNAGVDLRAQGGTIKIEGTDTVADNVALSLADGGSGAEINVAGLSDDMFDLNGFGGGDLRVDGTTAVFFDDLRVTAGTIDVLDWAEGGSTIVFTDLGRIFYGGTIAEGEEFAGLTVGGLAAFMTAFDDGTNTGWAVTAVPEPGTYALLAGMLSLAWVMVRRRK